MNRIVVNTIGFTKTSASAFFSRLRSAGVKRVVDVRLNNTSQLAGFAKSDDLKFFLSELCEIDYVHALPLAPEPEMLDVYKKGGGSWRAYEAAFIDLLERRRIETMYRPEQFDGACLLCSEDKPHHCHRRLVVEYLNIRWGGRLDVRHL